MGFILEDRTPDGRANAWYGGQNKKYYDLFNLVPEKRFAHVFESKKEAEKIANSLNKGGWNFVVLEVDA